MEKNKVAILCSGGDGPGMNACIYYLTKFLEENNFSPFGIVGGYDGLIEGNIIKLSSKDIEHSIYRGGCIIKAGRSAKFLTAEGRKQAEAVVAKNKFNCILLIGGNGTMLGAKQCMEAGININFIGIPATVDADVFASDSTIGFDSAANANINLIKAITASTYAQGKNAVIEVMGRDCGKLSLMSAVGSASDILVVREVPQNIDEIIRKAKILNERGLSEIVVVAVEKHIDVEDIANAITQATGKETKTFVSSYAQRGADPSALDRQIAAQLAHTAFEQLKKKNYFSVCIIKNGKTSTVKLNELQNFKTNFDYDLYNSIFNF